MRCAALQGVRYMDASKKLHMLLRVLLAWAGLACRLSIGSSRCEAQPETAVSWPPAQRALLPKLSTAGADEDLLTVNQNSSWAACAH